MTLQGVLELAPAQGADLNSVIANMRAVDAHAPCRLSAGQSGWWGLVEVAHPLGAVVAVPAQLSRPAAGLDAPTTLADLEHSFSGTSRTRGRKPSYLRYTCRDGVNLSVPSAPKWQALGVVSAECADRAGRQGLDRLREVGGMSVLTAGEHLEQLDAGLDRPAVVLRGGGRTVELPFRPFCVGVSVGVLRRPGDALASASPVEVWCSDRWLALHGTLGAVYLRRSSPWAPRRRSHG